MKKWGRRFLAVVVILFAAFLLSFVFYEIDRSFSNPFRVFEGAKAVDWSVPSKIPVPKRDSIAKSSSEEGPVYATSSGLWKTGAWFNPTTIQVGDMVGGFTATKTNLVHTYEGYDFEFNGELAVTGVIAGNDPLCGPYISNIPTSTAIMLPHLPDTIFKTLVFYGEATDTRRSIDSLSVGDTISFTTKSYRDRSMPVDCGGPTVSINSLRVLDSVKDHPPKGGLPDLAALTFSMPKGWIVQSGDENHIEIRSPGFEEDDSLASFELYGFYKVSSGRKISITYKPNSIANGMSPERFADLELENAKDCSDCIKSEIVTAAGNAAFMQTNVWGPVTVSSLEAAHSNTNGGVDTLDVDMSPGILNDADRAFLMDFLASIKYK